MVKKNLEEPKIILGIETSCDETSAAVMQKEGKGVRILSNVVASSADLQAKYGGVIPEQAAREQLKSIIPIIKEAIYDLRLTINEIDAIAVTEGPGLIGSLLVGVETAKVLSLLWQKPLVPVNHLIGHFYANWVFSPVIASPAENWTKQSIPSKIAASPLAPRNDEQNIPRFPCIGLLVSGGHTDLILFTDHGKYEYLGGTRDDAVGEAFDKTARLLNLPYPGGPQIAKLAEQGNPKAFSLPRPMVGSKNFDFSFSGLKTAVSNIVHGSEFMVHGEGKESTNHELQGHNSDRTQNLAASVQAAIIDVLVTKTVRAAQTYGVEQIIVAGGVAANQKLAEQLTKAAREKMSHVEVFIPPANLCTDNAAYIAAAAFFNYRPLENPLTLQTNPNLSLQR